VSFCTKNIPLHKSSGFHALKAMKDSRLLFYVHGRKFYLAPPRRAGGPYYIRFEPPSNCGKAYQNCSSVASNECDRGSESTSEIDH